MKRKRAQPDEGSSATWRWRPAADRLWTGALRRAPDILSLAKPKTHIRLFQAHGILGERYAEALTADRLEGLLWRESGVPHHYLGQEPIGRNRDRRRFYAKYLFARERSAAKAVGAKPPQNVALFVKRGPGVSRPELEQFLNGLASKHFSAPKFLWHFRVAGVRVGAWEFVEGRSPSFSESAPGDISRVIEAVAGVNSVPESAVRHLGVPLRIPYVHPVAERAAAAMSTALREDSAILREVAADLADFAQVEGGLITRYHTLPHRCLTHNDIKPANLIIRSGDERLVIADWNSARVGVPGASLRFLATWSPDVQTKVAEHYVEHMGRQGVRLAVADVLFAMIATYVFKGLHEAVDAADVRKLRATLDRAARLAEADLSKSASLIGAS